MTFEKLKACPFCGEDGGEFMPRLVESFERKKMWHRVECYRCSCRTGDYLDVPQAIRQWNMRNRPKSETFGEPS